MFLRSQRNKVDHRNVNDDWVEDVTQRQLPEEPIVKPRRRVRSKA